VAGTVRQPWSELLRREIGSLSRRFQLRSGTAGATRAVNVAEAERQVGAAA
jgi:hypothetical protein